MRTAAMFLSVLAFPVIGISTISHAQQVTNSMTCQQARAVYKQQGRVFVRTRSGTILPRFGGQPVDSDQGFFCGNRRDVDHRSGHDA